MTPRNSVGDVALLDDYSTVLGIIGGQVATITDDDLVRPTPCAEWDVAALVSHVLGAVEYYAMLVREGTAEVRELVVPVAPGDDLVELHERISHAGLAVWSAPGALDRECRMLLGSMPTRDALAIHVADLAVHACDLGRALGHSVSLPPRLAETSLATWQGVLARHDLRGIVFTDEVTVSPDADPTERLLAYCGRAS